MSDEDLARRVAHGLSYPFNPPGHSYLFREGRIESLDRFDPTGRVPVVASGSNGSPQRLAEKYADKAEIPVTFGTIRDLVPVFAARITGYGSIPATLAVVPGASAGVHVTWLTADQLEIMHGTESVGVGYAYVRMTGFDLDLGAHGRPDTAYAYLSIQGSFTPEGKLMPLAEVTQSRAQEHAMNCIGFPGSLDEFVGQHLQDVGFRREIDACLGRFAEPIGHPQIERLI